MSSGVIAENIEMGPKPRGCTLTTLDRAERVASLLQTYQAAGATIIAEELL